MNGPMSPSDLAKTLGLTTAAVTTVVDRLAALGHATRTPNPADRRGVVVVPSPASVAKAMGAIMPAIMGIDRAIRGFSESEQATITAYLEKVAEAYRAQLPASARTPQG
jgi:DNA-binding MarR family transcriptional regulator